MTDTVNGLDMLIVAVTITAVLGGIAVSARRAEHREHDQARERYAAPTAAAAILDAETPGMVVPRDVILYGRWSTVPADRLHPDPVYNADVDGTADPTDVDYGLGTPLQRLPGGW